MILPRSAAIDGAHEPAELDPDQEHVGVGRVGRDPANVRGPWARREAPRRSRRQFQKRLQLPPGRTAIVAAKERARFGPGIHSAVDRTYRKREDPRRRQLAVDPTAAAVSSPPDASLAEPGVGDVGIVWIDGEALSAAAAERERDIPRSVALVEARDSVTGRAIQTSHSVTLSATSLAVTWPATPIVRRRRRPLPDFDCRSAAGRRTLDARADGSCLRSRRPRLRRRRLQDPGRGRQ